MNSKISIALSAIGITVILMVVIAPTLANQQTFGVMVKKVPPMKGNVKFVKRCFIRFGKRMCRWVPVPVRPGGGLTGGARPY